MVCIVGIKNSRSSGSQAAVFQILQSPERLDQHVGVQKQHIFFQYFGSFDPALC